jgi:minor extracellular serine protease Vpr
VRESLRGGARCAARIRIRGVLLASVAALVLTGVAAGASTQVADDASDVTKFQRIDPDKISFAGWTPAVSRAGRSVTAILKLNGRSVAEAEAAARRQGRSLSKEEKARLRAELQGRQNTLSQQLAGQGARTLYTYQDAYNGLAVRVALGQLAALLNAAGVESVHVARIIEPDNTNSALYIGAPAAWHDYDFTGDGVKVAVLDTGVDYTHANFGGPGTVAAFDANDGTVIEPGTFPTAKVVAGFDFVGDDYDADSDDAAALVPHPDPDPLDCNGHGSHVAGSAAGAGVLSSGDMFAGPYDGTTHATNSFRIGPGIAPEAKVMAYRVFGCAGSTDEATIVAAIDRAVEDGADVINMSLGSPFGRTDEPSVVATDNAAEAGTVVATSAGNSGPSAYITGAPGIASRAISSAALDAIAQFPGAILSLPSGPITAINANGAELPGGSFAIKVLRNADGSVSLGCDPQQYLDQNVAGKIVVTVRGVCARVARAIFGQKAGAAAVVMINNSAGFPPFEGKITSNPDTGEEFTVTIPFLGVRGVLGPAATADGDNLVAADGASTGLAPTLIANPGFRGFASFSSGGVRNLDSAPKPDVTAPGVSVVSTGVGTGNDAATISGTSMASPMTAGTAALVTQAHPAWSTERIKAAIMNTAENGSALFAGYNSSRGGTGVIQPRRAVDTSVLATTTGGAVSLAYGYEALGGAYSETLPMTLTNTGSSAVQYNIAGAFNGLPRGAEITASPNSVTVPAGGSATVDVTLALDAAEVAALPAVSTFVVGWGGLVSIRGNVVATPTTSGVGLYPLKVPFLVAPRGLSNIGAGAKAPYTRQAERRNTSTVLTNSGIHAGTADLYAWGITDANDVGPSGDGVDVRSAGVQVLPGEVLGGAASDRSLQFVINLHDRWSNAAVTEFDIPIDLQNDGRPEFFVVGVDFGAVTAGSFDGRVASFIFDAEGNLVNVWVAENPMNGSTIVLPTLASDIGLDPAVNSTRFNYAVAAFGIVPEEPVDVTASSSFRSHDPPVSTGDFIELNPGASQTLNLWVDKGKNAGTPQLGWLVVSIDDANGGAQADQIEIGSVP